MHTTRPSIKTCFKLLYLTESPKHSSNTRHQIEDFKNKRVFLLFVFYISFALKRSKPPFLIDI